MTSEFAFSLRGVEFAYPNARNQALRGIDLHIGDGEWVALLGANGSGKSTLARVFNALQLPTQGACFVFGQDSRDAEAWLSIRQKVALVFQNPEDQIVASVVEEDVAFGPENLGLPSNEIRQRVDWALEMVGLKEKQKAPVYTLSGGQKQRLAIAGALALRPRCLVLDEATAMLDPQGRRSLLELLQRLRREGVTLIQITHRLEEILSVSRVIVMETGKIAWDGTPERFFTENREGADFEMPSCLTLRNLLAEKKLIPEDTFPDISSMLGALCPLG